MTGLNKRRWLDFGIAFALYMVLALPAGAGLWALLIFPFGLWNFYDGMTRNKLHNACGEPGLTEPGKD